MIKTFIIPDSLSWLQNPYLINYESMVRHYFSGTVYSNYPVVGVNFWQAMAYCKWKSQVINEALNKHYNNKPPFTVEVNLPTAAEWEYAAVDNKSVEKQTVFIWGDLLEDKNGKYQANFGSIIDNNGVFLKPMDKDGFKLVAPVKSFKPNLNGLFDMAGNVAEWTLDNAYIPNSFLKEEENLVDFTAHNLKVLKNDADKMSITKGGSFIDAPINLLTGVKTAHKKDIGYYNVGFRPVMYFLKK